MNLSRCETVEINISALLDGEANLHEQIEVVEHILTCRSCRQFFEESRELQDLVDLLPAESSPVDFRSDIDSGEKQPAAGRSTSIIPRGGHRLQGWLQAAAVLILLTVSFWAGRNLTPLATDTEVPVPQFGRSVDVQLASDPEGMGETEFVALTLELLQADPRYQRKMYEILGAIQDDSDYTDGEIVTARGAREGSSSSGQEGYDPEQESERGSTARTMIY